MIQLWSHGHDPRISMILWAWSWKIWIYLWSHDHDPTKSMIPWSWSWSLHDPMILILIFSWSHDHDPGPSCVHHDPWWITMNSKLCFFDFLKVVLELFRSCLGIIFGLKTPNFKCIFGSIGWYMTSNIKILSQKLALWEGHFDHFWGQKSRFLDFLEGVLE